MLGRLSSYFGELSPIKLAEYSKPIAWILRCFRMVYYIFDEFVKDNCLQSAASLSFTTLLSLVPLAAISLAILSRFKFSQESIQNLLMQYLLPTASFQQVIIENIQKFARKLNQWFLVLKKLGQHFVIGQENYLFMLFTLKIISKF